MCGPNNDPGWWRDPLPLDHFILTNTPVKLDGSLHHRINLIWCKYTTGFQWADKCLMYEIDLVGWDAIGGGPSSSQPPALAHLGCNKPGDQILLYEVFYAYYQIYSFCHHQYSTFCLLGSLAITFRTFSLAFFCLPADNLVTDQQVLCCLVFLCTPMFTVFSDSRILVFWEFRIHRWLLNPER